MPVRVPCVDGGGRGWWLRLGLTVAASRSLFVIRSHALRPKVHGCVSQTVMGVALLEGREDACPGDGFLIAKSATQSCMVRPKLHDYVAFSAILEKLAGDEPSRRP